MELETNIKYKGIVDVNTISENNITKISVHNSSTTEMSLIFAKALLNQAVTPHIPTQLDLGYLDDNNNFISIITTKKPLTGGRYKLVNGRYVTSYDVVITYENLSSTDTSHLLCVRLFSNNNVELARANLTNVYSSIITKSTSLQITWNLSLIDTQ